jgi:CheY-like chemotaxis protein
MNDLTTLHKPIRVLVVDDNTDAADSLKMILQLLDYEGETAYSGRAALEISKRARPDVILLDLGMPDLDGYEVARRLKQDPQTERIPLLAITGYADQAHLQQSRLSNFADHIVKPFSIEQLQKALAPLCNAKAQLTLLS